MNELEKLDIQIRQSVVSGNESEFDRLNSEKSLLEKRLFFVESRNIREQINELESDRAFNISQESELRDELKQASEVVLRCRSELYDANVAYESVQLKQVFLEDKIKQQRLEIIELKNKLKTHINKKLGENENE